MDDIETLSKRLRFLNITNKASSKMNKQSDEEMSIAPVSATIYNNI